MSDFEQMMSNIEVPEAIATQISKAANNGEVAKAWEQMSPIVDDAFKTCSTAAAVAAISMMVAYTGDQLAGQMKFGQEEDDCTEKVHPNFCIMAIALMAINTLKASTEAWEKHKGDGDGDEEKGQDSKESGEEESGEKASSDAGST